MTIATTPSSSSSSAPRTSNNNKSVPMATKKASAELKMWKAKLLEKYQAFKMQQEQQEQQQEEQTAEQIQSLQTTAAPSSSTSSALSATPKRAVSPMGPLVMPQAPVTLKHGSQCSGVLQIHYPKTWGPKSLTQSKNNNQASAFFHKTTSPTKRVSPAASPSLVALEDIPTQRILELFQESSTAAASQNDLHIIDDSIDMKRIFTF